MPTEMESLIELLKSGKKPDAVVAWATVREEWSQAVAELFDDVESWLEPARAAKLLRVERRQLHRVEEQLGEYETESLAIEASSGRLVSLTPQYRLVFGALGRVDLITPTNRWELLRTRPGEWVILHRRVPREQETLNAETFARILKESIE